MKEKDPYEMIGALKEQLRRIDEALSNICCRADSYGLSDPAMDAIEEIREIIDLDCSCLGET